MHGPTVQPFAPFSLSTQDARGQGLGPPPGTGPATAAERMGREYQEGEWGEGTEGVWGEGTEGVPAERLRREHGTAGLGRHEAALAPHQGLEGRLGARPSPLQVQPRAGGGSCALARMRWPAHPWCPGLLQVSCFLGMTLSRV